MFREPEMCKRWWHESGGWDISYPSYEWYGTSAVLNREIDVETKYMYKFVRDNNLEFDFNVSQIDEWLEKHLPAVHESGAKFKQYTRKLDETIWPILYKGKNHAENTSGRVRYTETLEELLRNGTNRMPESQHDRKPGDGLIKLDNIDFRGADLSNMEFDGLLFDECDFTGAKSQTQNFISVV